MKNVKLLAFTLLIFLTNSALGQWTNNSNSITTSDKVGIGTTSPNVPLSFGKNLNRRIIGLWDSPNGWYGLGMQPAQMRFQVGHLGARFSFFAGDNSELMTVRGNGRVGIGTLNAPMSIGRVNISNYRLFVKGGILTDEVRVRTGWADYVFADDYELRSLEELESFIQENKHLPNIPSEAEVLKDGVGLGEMAKLQQEKIEELYLYIIEQDKRIRQLEEKIESISVEPTNR